MGEYLRTRGNKVDFVKLENWLNTLQLSAMAELQGNVLISVFGFDEDEIPFVTKTDPNAYRLTLRSIQTWQGTLRMNGTSNKTLQGLFKTTTQCSNATYDAVFATLDMHPSRRQVTSFATSLEAFLK